MIARRTGGLASWHWAANAANQKKKMTANFFIIGLNEGCHFNLFPDFHNLFSNFMKWPSASEKRRQHCGLVFKGGYFKCGAEFPPVRVRANRFFQNHWPLAPSRRAGTIPQVPRRHAQ